MKKILVSMLIAIAFFTTAQAQNSTGYAKKIAEKRFDSTSIPASFKNYKGTLIVSSDIKGKRGKKKLENLMEGYEGKYEIVDAGKDLAQDFPNASKDQFILHVNSGIGLSKGSGGINDNYSYLTVVLNLSNRFTKEEFKNAFNAADYWEISFKYLLDRLNAMLYQKN